MSEDCFDFVTEVETECDSASNQPVSLPPPSRRLLQFAQWFRIGLSLFLILSVLLGIVGCASQAATPWQPASQVLPKEVLLEVVKQHSSQVPQPERVVETTMRAWVMPAKEGRVAVFDFHDSGWCGAGGCYYPVYWLKNATPPQLLMAKLFYPRLPKNKALFGRGDDNGQPIPCLAVWQPETPNLNRLRLTQYCYNGSHYESASSQVFDNSQANQ